MDNVKDWRDFVFVQWLRGTPACKMAIPRAPATPTHSKLAASLHCYVSDEDAELSREDFLRNVLGRIEMDIETGDY